ncbi:MAG: hypothetical protein KBH11_05285 [Bacteroidia bacterium]|nr:hypothetical protein [Bacteroidia bacterium]
MGDILLKIVEFTPLILHVIPIPVTIYILAKHYQWKKSIYKIPFNSADYTRTSLDELNRITTSILWLLFCMITVILADYFLKLNKMSDQISYIQNRTDQVFESISCNHIDSCINVDGTNGIYEDVEIVLNSRINSSERLQIDVLGFTLASTQPQLQPWLDRNYLNNLTLNLYYLDTNFLKDPIFDRRWSDLVPKYYDYINEFKAVV